MAALEKPSDLIIGVVGPTASGKTDLALDLAEVLPGILGVSAARGGCGGAEIVSVDAMQLYKGMDIGTAKAPLSERRGITHHQIDVLHVTDDANVSAYQREARQDIRAIHDRGAVAIAAGGSGLYLRALLDVINFPPTDERVRSRLEAQSELEGGTRQLYERLRSIDPDSAARIDANNARRIIRALEVYDVTGKPFTAFLPTGEFVTPTVLIGVRRELPDLDQRIVARTKHMFDGGLIEETAGLVDQGLRQGRTASRATGYAQALAVIDGTMDIDQAIESVSVSTRQLSRRQIKWFRPDRRIHWLDAFDHDHSSREGLLRQALKIIDETLANF